MVTLARLEAILAHKIKDPGACVHSCIRPPGFRVTETRSFYVVCVVRSNVQKLYWLPAFLKHCSLSVWFSTWFAVPC
jgi:hypothetical protein